MSKLIHEELSYAIRGALYEVYDTLGPGFREETYKLAVLVELERRSLPFNREKIVDVVYKGRKIDTYRLDIIVDDKVILEL